VNSGRSNPEKTRRRRARSLEDIKAALDAIDREYERLRGRPLMDEGRRRPDAEREKAG
jgi:hypothetical protein